MSTAPKQTKTAPTVEKPISTATPQADTMDWGQEQASGFEGTRPEDLGIPFLSLLQKGSPEVDEDHPDHATKKIEGVKAGMIINTLTRQIVFAKDDSNPLLFVPVFHEKLYQEWKPRNQGGGFVQSHRSPVILTKTKRNEKNKDILPNGHEIITTSYFYGFAMGIGEEGKPLRCIIALTSTQLKKARMWLNMMQTIKINGKTPPMFSHSYAITSVSEQNAEGSWYGWKFEVDRTLTKADMPLIEAARSIAAECAASSNKMLAAPSTSEEAGSSEDDAADAEARRLDRKNRQ
jgi:hypothetical protein